MRHKPFIFAISLLFTLGMVTQCEKYGNPGGGGLPDEDSDRPAWAGGNTDENPHIRGNDDSGTSRGGDYGDLYVLLRDLDGVPVMLELPEVDEDGVPTGEFFWVTQPVDEFGVPLELDAEGELTPESLLKAIPVDFGRLNIVRSPQTVLDQAFNEAMKVLTATDAVITLDFCGRLTSTYTDDLTGETIVKTIDSPRENMAIYQYIMKYMFENTAEIENRLGFLKDDYGFDPLQIAASCFAAGSDKTGSVDIDEVVYINGFVDGLGLNPILNEHEYDFSNDNKYYFNFGDPYDCDCDSLMFRYRRGEHYADRYIQFLVWGNEYFPEDENGNSPSPYIFPILDVMEGLVPELGGNKFTYAWTEEYEYRVKGFAIAVDDAVQVLDYIHGDSNIKFLPGYAPGS